MSGKWAMRNPAVKRIMQELREMEKEDSPDLLAEAIEEDIFEWHFVIRGAWDSEFEGGIYHGRILMPADYPFKPPAFVMLTPSGRFETGVKICLSISSHHPESWQPSWSVRSALVALIAFMQTPGSGALGSLDHPEEARRQMAAESRTRPPKYGNKDRQALIDSMHQRMLEMEERSRQLCKAEQQHDAGAAAPAEAGVPEAAPEATAAEAEAASTDSAAAGEQPAAAAAAAAEQPAAAPAAAAAGSPPAAAVQVSSPVQPTPVLQPSPALPPSPPAAELRQRPTPVAAAQPSSPPALQPVAAAPLAGPAAVAAVPHDSWEDRGLTYLAVLLVLCIAALLIRKVMLAVSLNNQDLYSFNHVEGVEL
jgi:ubiquitin-conjugating enzyme E2 J1